MSVATTTTTTLINTTTNTITTITLNEKQQQTGIYDEIEIEDMEFNDEKQTYYYPCPW